MEEYLTLFPLQIVAFPYERVPLHIFEPRYRELMRACQEEGKRFGLLAVLEGKPAKVGVRMRLDKIVNNHPDGRLDVVTRGEAVFILKEFIPAENDNECHKALVSWPENVETVEDHLYFQAKERILRLFQLIKADPALLQPNVPLSYQVPAFAGLGPGMKVELLSILREDERLEWLMNYLDRLIPTLEEIERAREQVQQNGHYRILPNAHIDPDLLK